MAALRARLRQSCVRIADMQPSFRRPPELREEKKTLTDVGLQHESGRNSGPSRLKGIAVSYAWAAGAAIFFLSFVVISDINSGRLHVDIGRRASPSLLRPYWQVGSSRRPRWGRGWPSACLLKRLSWATPGVLGRLTTRVVGIQHMQAAGDRRWLSPSAGTRLGGHVSRAGRHDAARAPMVYLWRCGISIVVPSLCKLVLLRAAGGLCRAGLPGTVGRVAGVTALAASNSRRPSPQPALHTLSCTRSSRCRRSRSRRRWRPTRPK